MSQQNPIFKLYTHPHSANGRKVLALTYHLHLQPEIVLVNIYQGEGQRPEYLQINPLGKIPALVDGDFILWESNAILQYIAEKFGNFQLSSPEPQKRADIARWLFWETAHWQPAVTTVLTPVVAHRVVPQLFPEPKEAPQWEQLEFKRWAAFLNTHLASLPFLVGDELTLADISVAGMMTYFRFAKFPFDEYPALGRWYALIEGLEAWKKSESPLWTV